MERSGESGEPAVGHEVVAANGEVLGKVREAYPHYILVEREGTQGVDLDVPMRAVSAVEGGRIVLRVNLEALTEVPDEDQTAGHRIEEEG